MKLAEALTTLTKEEWTSFRKYQAMFTRPDSDSVQLLEGIQRKKTKILESKTWDNLKNDLFPTITQKSFLNLQSKIYQWLADWFVYYDLKHNSLRHELQLAKSLTKRGLFRQAEQIASKIENQILEDSRFDIENDRILHELAHIRYYSDNPIKYHEPLLLRRLFRHFGIAIKSTAQLYLAESHNWGKLKKLDLQNENDWLNLLVDGLPENELSTELRLLTDFVIKDDLSALQKFRADVYGNCFKPDSELHILAVFYLITNVRRYWHLGHIAELQELFDVYNYAMKTGVLMTNGKIAVMQFLNIIDILAYQAKGREAHDFIDRWLDKVDSKNPQALRPLAEAQISLQRGEYSEIIDLLNVEFPVELTNKIRAQVLLLIAYYECRKSYYQILMNHTENFNRQLLRNRAKLSEAYFQGAKNLIKIVLLLSNADYKKNQIDVSQFKFIYLRSWALKAIKRSAIDTAL